MNKFSLFKHSRSFIFNIILLMVISGCTHLKKFAYEGFNRDRWQQPQKVIDSLALEPDDHVADIGSGSGYFTFRLADAVGREGMTYAVDVDSEMVRLVDDMANKRGYDNVETIIAAYSDPLLPESRVDIIFTCNTYHHLENRTTYFQSAKKYLRPGGKLAIIDLDGRGWFIRLLGHWTVKEAVISEMRAAGYQLDADYDFLDKQSFLVFSVKE